MRFKPTCVRRQECHRVITRLSFGIRIQQQDSRRGRRWVQVTLHDECGGEKGQQCDGNTRTIWRQLQRLLMFVL